MDRAWAWLLLATLALVAACSGGSGGVRLTLSLDDGNADTVHAVELRAGEELELKLESNRTTGYEWEVVAPPSSAVLELRSSDYRGGDDPDVVGQGGVEVWKFVASGAGSTEMEMRYHFPGRPDEPGVVLSFAIQVEPAD